MLQLYRKLEFESEQNIVLYLINHKNQFKGHFTFSSNKINASCHLKRTNRYSHIRVNRHINQMHYNFERRLNDKFPIRTSSYCATRIKCWQRYIETSNWWYFNGKKNCETATSQLVQFITTHVAYFPNN